MAKDKKSFLLYCDFINTFEDLSDEEAGRLIKHIFRYVNDQDPQTDDRLIKIAFGPIKQQLKRDLRNWESERCKRSDAGKKGMAKRWGRITNDNSVIPTITNITDNVTVTDNVNVNVTERENGGFWADEVNKKFSLDHCLEVSLKDDGWVSRNNTNRAELQTFNEYLEKIADTEKTINDYKRHFGNKKLKNPELFKNAKSGINKQAIEAFKKTG